MSVRSAAALLWGCAIGLAINLAAIHSRRAAVVSVFTFALIFIAAVLYDEWRHPAGYWTTPYRGNR